MSWQIFPNVTLTNGSKNIAINDSASTAGILAGYAVNKDNKSYEIESITSSAIILVDAWSEATAANVKIKIQPTSEPIKEYIQETLGEVKGLVADYLARLQLEESIISSTGTVSFTDSAGVSHDIPGWGNLGTAAAKNLATLTEAKAGAAGVLPDAEQVAAYVQQFTDAHYQPNIAFGIGVVRKMKNKSGGSIPNGAEVNGSALVSYYIDAAGVMQEAGTPSGIWKNTSGSNVGNGNGVDFTRMS